MLQVAGQRWTSPTVDAGSLLVDGGPAQLLRQNLLANPGFESGTAGWEISPDWFGSGRQSRTVSRERLPCAW